MIARSHVLPSTHPLYQHMCMHTYLIHSHLSVLFDYHKTFGVQPCVLVQLLDCIVANQSQLHTSQKLSTETAPISCSPNISGDWPGDWAEHLLNVLQGLLAEVYSFLCNHLILLDMTTTNGIESLTWWIQ